MFKLVVKSDLGFELWQDIPGYEGLYEASTYGRIRNKKSGRILTPSVSEYGYCCTAFSVNGKRINVRVARIISQTFLPKPQEEQTQVNHKDENKLNNRVENLEWCDCKYNINYGTHKERMSRSQRNDPKKSKQILQYDLRGNLIATYPSAHEAKRINGYSDGNIRNCCRGLSKTAYGFIWKFA